MYKTFFEKPFSKSLASKHIMYTHGQMGPAHQVRHLKRSDDMNTTSSTSVLTPVPRQVPKRIRIKDAMDPTKLRDLARSPSSSLLSPSGGHTRLVDRCRRHGLTLVPASPGRVRTSMGSSSRPAPRQATMEHVRTKKRSEGGENIGRRGNRHG